MNSRELFRHLQKLTGRKPTQQEIADILGITQGAVGNKIARSSDFTKEEIEKIQNFYNIVIPKQTDDTGCIALPVIGNIYAAKGCGIEINEQDKTAVYRVSRALLKDAGADPDNTVFIPCEGDSMLPLIEGGSLLMADCSKTDAEDGKIYCVRINGKFSAKRLQFIPPDTIRVISDNCRKYKPFEIEQNKDNSFDFAIIGQIKWHSTFEK